MADINQDLILYLKLDNIDARNNTVLDSAQPDNYGMVNKARLVADDLFGSCLSFDGINSTLSTKEFNASGLKDHTLAAWIKAEEQDRAFILMLGQYGDKSQYWHVNPLSNADAELEIGDGRPSSETFKTTIALREWTHIATSYAQGKLTVYINGEQVGKTSFPQFIYRDTRITLAKAGGAEELFKGKIAQVKLYRRALGIAEIAAFMEADQLAIPAYRDAHPIAFSLCDANENYALYIDNDPKEKQSLNLELRNTSAKTIKFELRPDKAPRENYHFELVFRNGVLSAKTLQRLVDSQSPVGKQAILGEARKYWDVYCSGEDQQRGTTSLKFLYKPVGNNLKPNDRLLIPLQQIYAQAGTGARGTRVELRLNQISYVDDNVPITGSRVQHLQIISHIGSRRSPFHVGFAGSNRVLNDGGSESTLVLQVMNVLRAGAENSITLTPKFEILLTFDVEDTSSHEVAPWSLCTEAEYKNLVQTDSVYVAALKKGLGDFLIVDIDAKTNKPKPDQTGWKVEQPGHGLAPATAWRITPNSNITLTKDQYFQIVITNIKSKLPSGFTNLYFDYRGIDGFWDGQVVCLIEKTPLMFLPGENHRKELERRVGVDTLTPQNVLDVNGSAVIGKGYAGTIKAPEGVDLLVVGKVGIGTKNPLANLAINGGLHVGGDSDPGDKNVLIDGKLAAKLAIHGSLHVGGDSDPGDKNVLIDGKLTVLQGNVGIGTNTPAAKLALHGGLHVGGDSDPGDNNVLIDGKLTVLGGSAVYDRLEFLSTIESNVLHKDKKVANIQFENNVFHKLNNDGTKTEYLSGDLHFQTMHFDEMKTRMVMYQNGCTAIGGSAENPNATLTVLGSISEKLEILKVDTYDGWDKNNQVNYPLRKYFLEKLSGKPKGTMIKVLADLRSGGHDWSGHFWTGWVAADGSIRFVHNGINTSAMARGPEKPPGIVVYAD